MALHGPGMLRVLLIILSGAMVLGTRRRRFRDPTCSGLPSLVGISRIFKDSRSRVLRMKASRRRGPIVIDRGGPTPSHHPKGRTQ